MTAATFAKVQAGFCLAAAASPTENLASCPTGGGAQGLVFQPPPPFGCSCPSSPTGLPPVRVASSSATPSLHRTRRRLHSVDLSLEAASPDYDDDDDDDDPPKRRHRALRFSLPAAAARQPTDDDASLQASSRQASFRQASSRHPSSPQASSSPHPAVRISKHIHKAILYAFEEALRHPHAFTPDAAEESAAMTDLLSPTGASSSSANAAEPRRPSTSIGPTGSPSGIKGPRAIMQERAAREARQREQRELIQERARAQERLMAQNQAQLLEETARRAVERSSSQAEPFSPTQSRPYTHTRHHPQPASLVHASLPHTSHQAPRTAAALTPLPLASQSTRPQPQGLLHPDDLAGSNERGTQAQPGQPHPNQPHPSRPAAQMPDVSKTRNSFPHAFERWETLSAHWEGLTSYWIRKIEQNKDELNRDPMSQQLARQVTDLSAAGANLFHAVVELQRLRASSERKFQRWFFETRAELERAQEINAMMEVEVQKERRERAEAIREAVDNERASSKVHKQLAEMRKELSISKEEARRAWEELGRREQEERERTLSLQHGHPTIVGGVQVVPMAHGVAPDAAAEHDDAPGNNKHFSTSAPAQPTTNSARTAYPTPAGDDYSPGKNKSACEGDAALVSSAYSVSDAEAEEEYETSGASTQPPSAAGYDPAAGPASSPPGRWPMSASTESSSFSDPQDYSGQGYGAPGWETVPRHHHPTRLSDVIEEEDERSRTSASQRSRG